MRREMEYLRSKQIEILEMKNTIFKKEYFTR